MVSLEFPTLQQPDGSIARTLPGVFAAFLIALCAHIISEQLGGSPMLYALLLGMLANALRRFDSLPRGVEFASSGILRVGVALLGLQVTIPNVIALGLPVVALVLSGVILTLIGGIGLGRACGLNRHYSLLTAGSVAICGASAALAIASVLPRDRELDQMTMVTLIAVTALSTAAMIVYPMITGLLNFGDRTAGIFLGATIHDIAQVVGAGYIVSAEAAEVSIVVKLIRVLCLVPVVALTSIAVRGKLTKTGASVPALPGFMAAFVVLVVLNSSGIVNNNVAQFFHQISDWCLLTAVAAIGMKTSVQIMLDVGFQPFQVIALQTSLLALTVLFGIAVLHL